MELQWELMFFTLFVCVGAGIFGCIGLLAVLGRGKALQRPALLCSLVSIAVGGLGAFLHLQHWERIFNGFGHLSSGITQELIAVAVFALALVVYFVVLRQSGEGSVPKWAGVMALVISVALVVVMAHSYSMASRPMWDTPILWLYYFVNAGFFGCLAVSFIAACKKHEDTGFMIACSLVTSIAQAVVTVIYSVFFAAVSDSFADVQYYFDPTHPTKELVDASSSITGIFTGAEAPLFWIGIVIVGLIAPLVLLVLLKKKPAQARVYLGISLLAALVGGMCFRVVLYLLGSSVFMFY